MSLAATPYVISALEHSAQLFRQTLNCLISGSGVVGATDLEVTEHSAANLSVNVAPGYVFLPGTQGETTGQRTNASSQHGTYNSIPASFTSQGVYLAVASSVTNLSISEGGAKERIDLICALVQDAEHGGSFNQALLSVVKGTEGVSAKAPTPPENSVVLAQVQVAAGAKEIKKANITNERPYAGVMRANTSFGYIGSGGEILYGTEDFTISHPGAGEYYVVWNKAKATANYVVVCTTVVTEARVIRVSELKTTEASLLTFNTTTGVASNSALCFIALAGS